MKMTEENINVELPRETVQEIVADNLSTPDYKVDSKELDSLSDETLAKTFNMENDKEEGLQLKKESVEEKVKALVEGTEALESILGVLIEKLSVKEDEAKEILEYYGI